MDANADAGSSTIALSELRSGELKRYGLQPENRRFQCLDPILTLACVDMYV